ncbi:hypothetical protein SeMB42_g07553 [Synchytrium endobioticum]|uniref:Uncharacterized protein n=1 Tax=Synchytrium endobioticum TaxID=286115 RepID=A0A507D0N7_9FUNG|nr:hypothetical protein SeMB42_g07553 [Synchytrium endobioticum]TPX44871.1 hypothetical protein SeLEV6574_g04246 [Synchytrium endobioticum]
MNRSDSKYRLYGSPTNHASLLPSSLSPQIGINRHAIYPLIRSLLVASSAVFLFLFFLLYDTKYSWFDIKTTNTNAHNDEAARLASSKAFLLTLPHAHAPAPAPSDSPGLCIYIISGSPRPQQYLTQATAFLLSRTDSTQSRIAIVNTNIPPSAHSEAIRLAQHVPILIPTRRNVTTDDEWTQLSWWKKGSYDFAAVFDLAHDSHCLVTVVLEDDAVVGPAFSETVRRRLARLLASDESQCSWAYIKLFWTHYWDGWEVSVADVLVLAAVSLTAGIVCALVALARLQRRRALGGSAVQAMLLVVFAFGCVVALLVLLSVGKQNWRRWLGASETGVVPSVAAAAAVGQVYSKCHLRGMADFLYARAADDVPVDILFNAYVAEKQVRIYEVVPNVVQHVGLYSSAEVKNKGTAKFMKVSSTFVGDSVKVS